MQQSLLEKSLYASTVNPAREGDTFVFAFDALGTRWEIETREPIGRELQARILTRVDRFDAAYSRFRPDSLVSRIAAASQGGRFEFPSDSVALFELYDRLHAATRGALDPLVGRDLELLGYDRTYSLKPAPESAWAEARSRGRSSWSLDVVREGTLVITQRPLVIDVGAAGKGYLVDLIADILREECFLSFVVDGSGDLRHSGAESLRVGLEHPFDPSVVIGVANVRARALCASAVNRRAWGNGLHHILDARTGVPVRGVVATWVVADDARAADGLATALFFIDATHLLESFPFSYVRMFVDGRAEISPNFDGELFT
jgi:FAD:protein FMN transferase